MENTVYWIWLSLVCQPASPTFGKLIKELKSPKAIYEADERQISSIVGYKVSDKKALENKSLDKAEEVYEFCKKHKVGILTYDDLKFPKLLREIENPPVLLYYRGMLPDFNNRLLVGAVGTRRLSDYGRRSAFKISYDLASAGAIVVSGMAIGIDGVATAGAISAGGSAVAVIGSGIDICYPPHHLRLAREIVKNGCVITEYAPGTPPVKHNFPRRNRIISGISSATVVFEGPENSGALITARCAKEQGRSVYALPGNIGAKNAELSTLLLKNGAKLCTCAEDIIGDYQEYSSTLNPFAMKEKIGFDMMSALKEYGVSAVCPSDEIFINPISSVRRTNILDNIMPRLKNNTASRKSKKDKNQAQEVQKEELNEPGNDFDKSAVAIYKRIPFTGSCSIEELVDSKTNLRDVMKCLLKLEMGGFVTLLPGEMVSRKFK